MNDTDEDRFISFAKLSYVLLSLLFLGGWLLCWRIGGATAWVLGTVLLAGAEQSVVSALYALSRGNLDFASQHKEREIAAQAAIVGIWLRHAGAPFVSLLVLPLYDMAIRAVNKRVAREDEECISLGASTIGTLAGQIAGYVLYWALAEG